MSRSQGSLDLEIGVEKQEAAAAETHLVGRDRHRACRERDRDLHALARSGRDGADRCVTPIDDFDRLLLPSRARDPLMEIAARVHEPHPDDATRRGRLLPCSDRRRARRGRRCKSAASCADRTPPRSRRCASARAHGRSRAAHDPSPASISSKASSTASKRLTNAGSAAALTRRSSGTSCSSLTGLCSVSFQRVASMASKSALASSFQLHQRL